jgi:hypothetical protein
LAFKKLERGEASSGRKKGAMTRWGKEASP